jgi:hypothetical protein
MKFHHHLSSFLFLVLWVCVVQADEDLEPCPLCFGGLPAGTLDATILSSMENGLITTIQCGEIFDVGLYGDDNGFVAVGSDDCTEIQLLAFENCDCPEPPPSASTGVNETTEDADVEELEDEEETILEEEEEEEDATNNATTTSCYTDLNAVFVELSNDDALASIIPPNRKRFVICPNTVLVIGQIGVNGQYPIAPRSNTEFLCGAEGLSTNNCIVQGGDFGILGVPVLFPQVSMTLTKGAHYDAFFHVFYSLQKKNLTLHSRLFFLSLYSTRIKVLTMY